MCGRYASSRRPEDLIEEFGVERVEGATPLPPDYNVAPTKPVYAVLDRVPRDADAGSAAVRRLRPVTWGLIPSWAKARSIGSRLINARVETLAEKPAFRRAFAIRRCLLPADGYYEWYPTQRLGRSGRPLKQPFFIHRPDSGVLAMAGLYEIWRDHSVADPDVDGAFVWSCTVITTQAADSVGRIHDRMPMLVEPSRYTQWLDPALSDADRLRGLLIPALLVPALDDQLEAFPVSTEVNDVANNGPGLVEPIPLDAALGIPSAAEGTATL